MSSSSQPAEAASSRKRPHHFHDGPSEQSEKPEAKTPASPPSSRLYKHALESIFDFLSLADLSRVLVVSHSWSSAVDSMRSIGASMESLPAAHSLTKVCSSRMARHIGKLGSKAKPLVLLQERLFLAGLCMKSLHSLDYKLSPPVESPFIFPPSLKELDVGATEGSPPGVNLAIVGASGVPHLRSFTLRVPALDPLVSFAPLRQAAELQELCLLINGILPPLSLQQADELRAIPNLTDLNWQLDVTKLRLLLRAPHQLTWTKLHTTGRLVELTGLLASLDLLTELKMNCECDANFLQHVPNLRALALSSFAWYVLPPSPEQMIEGVRQCEQLTSLTITCSQLTVAHMTALLSRMPVLCKLDLSYMHRLESLQFLSSEPLQRSLTGLTLERCRHAGLRTKELRHILALQQLTHLSIKDCCSEKLDSFTLAEFEVPFRATAQAHSVRCRVHGSESLII